MAASEKTEYLGLNLWAATDKPRRVDFVADNQALETLVGGHLQDQTLHLDDLRRSRLDAPYEVRTYTGNGAATRTLVFSFRPTAVLVFAQGHGFAEQVGGCTKQYAGMAVEGSHSLGLELSTIQVTLSQAQTTPGSGSMACFNENGVSYAVLAMR